MSAVKGRITKPYVYEAYDYMFRTGAPRSHVATTEEEFDLPDQLVLFVAQQIACCGDGRARLLELIQNIGVVIQVQDERYAREIANRMTPPASHGALASWLR